MRSKFESKVTEEFSSVQTTATTYTKETHVQEVVGVVSKITQKIDRLESTIDDLVKKLSRPPTDGSSRSSNITVSDFEISESETIRTETSETTSVTDQAKKWVEAEKKSYKEDFIEKVIKIGEDLKKRVKPDRYIPRVKQQCDRYDRKHQAPLFVERFEEVQVSEKGTIRLTAKVDGNPIPSVTWFRNNKILLASPRITEMFDGEQILLEIVDADSEEDAGDYKCVATNAIGSATNGAKVTVDVAKVYFTKKLPSKYEVDENKTVVLECETSHTVSTTWYHDKKELSGMDNRELVQEGRTQRLVIKKASRKDKGTYACAVKDQTTETKLIVHELPPEILTHMQDTTVPRGEKACLEVELTKGDALVRWFKDDVELQFSEHVQLSIDGKRQKLKIYQADDTDGGVYSCRVGDQVSTARLTVEEVPSLKIDDEAISQRLELRSQWKPTVEVSGYPTPEIAWAKDGIKLVTDKRVTTFVDEKSTTIAIYSTDRKDSGTYTVTATNIAGSTTLDLKLKVIAPPSPPNSIAVLNIASKSVTLQWEPPLSNGGSELTDYVIEKQDSQSNKWTKVVTLDANVLKFTVENLKEKSELYFRVFAENAVGLSLPTTTSLVSLKTHATVPSPPTAPLEMRSTGANSVMVSWGVPESDGGAPIEGYKIAVRDIKKTMWMEVGRVGADIQKLTIKDLQCIKRCDFGRRRTSKTDDSSPRCVRDACKQSIFGTEATAPSFGRSRSPF
ncbi:unnamed protein product [Nesidiocoris tenuis]|uniref:Titin n=1 Tax=Nesidiocoris tenuis TaxID=355587 RepID=A0A6H5FTU9_9HEMI|nr:unnamed protein product [Nesidiocoris tenuis]